MVRRQVNRWVCSAYALFVLCAISKGQELPSAQLLLSSWQSYFKEGESIKAYHLLGSVSRIEARQVHGMPRNYENLTSSSGHWEIYQANSKLRWQFKVPDTDRSDTITFDGRTWNALSEWPQEKGVVERHGNVLEHPERFFHLDPKTAFERGLSHVYPFTIENVLRNPISSPEGSLFDVFKKNYQDLIVRKCPNGFELTFDSRRVPGARVQQVLSVQFLVTDSRFVPCKYDVELSSGGHPLARGEVTLSDFQPVGPLSFPMSVIRRDWLNANRDVPTWKLLKEDREILRVNNVNGYINPDVFSIEFPGGMEIYDEQRGWQVVPKKRSFTASIVAWALLLLSLPITYLLLWRKRKRSAR